MTINYFEQISQDPLPWEPRVFLDEALILHRGSSFLSIGLLDNDSIL